MPEVCLEKKNYQKLFEGCVEEKFADATENERMLMNAAIEHFQL